MVVYMVLVEIVVGAMQCPKDTTLIELSVSMSHDSIHSRWMKESIQDLEVSLEGVAMAALFKFEGGQLKMYQRRRQHCGVTMGDH